MMPHYLAILTTTLQLGYIRFKRVRNRLCTLNIYAYDVPHDLDHMSAQILSQQFILKNTTVKESSKTRINDKGFFLKHNAAMLSTCIGYCALCPMKKIPDIIDCNLKKDYQILLIFGTKITDIKRPFKFLPHPMCVSALPGGKRNTQHNNR